MDYGRSCDLVWRCESSEWSLLILRLINIPVTSPHVYSKTITTSDVGTTIAMMEEVLNGDGSRSIVAGVIVIANQR